jgi:beta-glucanase (GH16 family)
MAPLNEQEQRELGKTLRTLAEKLDPPVVSYTPSTPVPASPPVPATSGGPLGATGNWKLQWQDDFSSPTLDLSRWRLGRPADAAGGHKGYAEDQGEKTFYLGEHVSIRDGKLVLTATNKPLKVVKDAAKQGTLDGDTYYSPQDSGTWQYRSGTVTTGPDRNGWLSAKASGGKIWTPQPAGFAFTYGFFSVRAKLPAASPGLWPALWFMPVDGSWSSEIDSVEQVDPTGRRIAQRLHVNDNAIDFTANPGLGFDTGKDMTADFHEYAIEWLPGSLKWLIDGVITQQTTSNVPSKPHYFIANVAVAGNWPGQPTAATKWPAEMILDWIRVYQRA